jgi:glycosyltransferase involved in cell wall biosynthesis
VGKKGPNSIFTNLAFCRESSITGAVVTDGTRVLYLAISGKRIGGAQIQYEYLIAGLDRSHYEPILLTRTYGEINETLSREGISTWALSYPLWRRKMLLVRYRARSRFVAFAQQHDVHLVHGDFDLGPYLVAIAETLGLPSVLHVRQSLTRGWIRRYALLRASALIAIGSRYRDQLLRYGVPSERITVITDATDLARFTPERPKVLRQEHPVMSDDVLFGIVGRIEPFKRQLDFLCAAEQVIAALVHRGIAERKHSSGDLVSCTRLHVFMNLSWRIAQPNSAVEYIRWETRTASFRASSRVFPRLGCASSGSQCCRYGQL